MKLLPLLLLISTISLAQTSMKDAQKKIVGYWEFQKSDNQTYNPFEELVFYADGKYLAGDQQMRCQGSWSIQNIEKKGFALTMTSSKACGAEQQTLLIASVSKEKLQFQVPYGESETDIIFHRQNKKPWKKTKMLKEVLGIWEMPSRRKEIKKMSVALMLQKDSFYMFDGGGPIVGPWDLSQDGRYLILKFADEPMVSIYAAAPGHFILPLSQKEGKWAAQMEKHTISKAKNGNTAKKLRKKIIGVWEAQEDEYSFKKEFRKDGTALFSIFEDTTALETFEFKWQISAEGKYVIIVNPTNTRRPFKFRPLSKDSNGKLNIQERRRTYTKTK